MDGLWEADLMGWYGPDRTCSETLPGLHSSNHSSEPHGRPCVGAAGTGALRSIVILTFGNWKDASLLVAVT